MVQSFQCEVGNQPLTIETGKLAQQTNAAVTVRYGDTVLLVTACAADSAREGIDFLPLTVDFEERLYAAGRIPGSFFRREGRPGQDGILAARLTDRPIRPLFPKGFRNEIQVVITVLSVDHENTPDILGTIGASAALSISDIPFEGPVSSTRVAYVDGEFVINPTFSQLEQSLLDLIVAGSRDAIVMVEAGAKEVDEATMLEALRLGQETNQQVIALQDQMVQSLGLPKMEVSPTAGDETLVQRVSALVRDRLEEGLYGAADKAGRSFVEQTLMDEAVRELAGQYEADEVLGAFEKMEKELVRRKILDEGIRPDGRGTREIRPISCEVGILPRTHGTGLFTRGQTQVLSITTLATLSAMQKLDTLSPEDTKRFIHHYNMPGYANGEVKRIGTPGRREIGHGALAERALLPVIPDEDAFPYTLRLVSEVLSSNGSTSMASVCASTLSLMDAGVPIAAPVAGIAMGLITGLDSFAVLTDIQGMEDHLGDMDFKVAGTAEGITALQMDIKVTGITPAIMSDALEQAREARMFILSKMSEAITQARGELSPYAPRVLRMSIPAEKIGTVIGPGGKTIRSLIDAYDVSIDVENDGTVYVASSDQQRAQQTLEKIKAMTQEVEEGAVYTGEVKRILDFGAFVEILPGREGLLRIGEISHEYVRSVEDVLQVGDEVQVKVIEIDSMGRVNLSRRALLEPPAESEGGTEGEGHKLVGTGSQGPRGRGGPPSRREGGGPPRGDRDRNRGPRRGPGGGRGR